MDDNLVREQFQELRAYYESQRKEIAKLRDFEEAKRYTDDAFELAAEECKALREEVVLLRERIEVLEGTVKVVGDVTTPYLLERIERLEEECKALRLCRH